VKALAADALSIARGGRPALTDATVTFRAGECAGVIGPNGAGKSTLLEALAGLLPPGAGAVSWDGRPLAAIPAGERARAIAYLPQHGAIHWALPVRDVVALGRLPHRSGWRGPGPEDAAAIDAALAATDTADLARRRATELSGGEQARVLLARALATRPRMLLADEPVAGLDPYHRLEGMETLAALAAGGMGVVVVLHDLTLAARFCRRLVLIDGGRIVADGAPDAVLTPERLAAAYRIEALAGRHRGEPYVIPWSRRGRADGGATS
jgi:iron complex transport system ATP-binding protein